MTPLIDTSLLPWWMGFSFAFVFGAILGSFGNVIIIRWPKEESLVTPRSRCGSCGKAIAWYDNIPVLSWFLLRGRCRKCGAAYSFRYPLIEFLSGALVAAVFAIHGWSFAYLELGVFVWALLVVSVIDLDHFLLPDIVTLPGIVLGLLGSFVSDQRTPWESLAGVLLGGGFLWLLAYLYLLLRNEDGMGGGDIKLLAWIGAVLGWTAVPFVILVASVVGSVVGLIAAARSDKGLKTMIPFGPYLALGAVLYIFVGESLAEGPLASLFPFLNF